MLGKPIRMQVSHYENHWIWCGGVQISHVKSVEENIDCIILPSTGTLLRMKEGTSSNFFRTTVINQDHSRQIKKYGHLWKYTCSLEKAEEPTPWPELIHSHQKPQQGFTGSSYGESVLCCSTGSEKNALKVSLLLFWLKMQYILIVKKKTKNL